VDSASDPGVHRTALPTPWSITSAYCNTPYVGVFMIGVLGMILFAATQAALAYLVKTFMHGTFMKMDPAIQWEVPIGVVVLFTLRGIGDYVQITIPAGWGARSSRAAARCVLALPALADGLSRRAAVGSHAVQTHLQRRIGGRARRPRRRSLLVGNSITIAVLLVYLFYLNWQLAVFCIVAAPVIGWLMQIANKQFPPLQQAHPKLHGRHHPGREGSHRCASTHQDLQRRAASDGAFRGVNETTARRNMKLARAKAISNPVVQLHRLHRARRRAVGLSIRQVFAHDMQVDEFMGFLTALMLIPGAAAQLVNVGGPLQQGIAAGQSVFEMLDQPTEGTGGSLAIARARGEIEFRNVSFTYGTEKGAGTARRELPRATRGNRGHRRALRQRQDHAGQFGAALLRRAGGHGAAGRRRRARLPLTDLRTQVSLVSQDVVLFNDTIRNNITFNAPRTSPRRSRGGGARRQRHGVRRAAAAGLRHAVERSRYRICPAASDSAFRLLARSSRIRRY
jgi:subfamily B ATP-binding cassette protein MsbA